MSKMPDIDAAAALHDAGWKEHEAVGFEWTDPTNPQKQKLSLAALAELGPPFAVRLLDYGCGNADCSDFFQRRGYQVHAVDVSDTVIKRNRARFPEIKFELVRPDQPAPYTDASFDAIFSSEVIEHVYDTQFVFSEFSRLLRPGGLLILTTPYHGLVKNLVIVLFYFERHFDPTWQHIRFWSKKSLTNISMAHGLQPVTWKHIGRFWPLSQSFFLVCRKPGETATQ
jgi:SAM-dependent methyltransferase